MPCAKGCVFVYSTGNLRGERRGTTGQLTRVVLRDHTYLGLSMFCKKEGGEGEWREGLALESEKRMLLNPGLIARAYFLGTSKYRDIENAPPF
jgi:hypothetical protein